MENKIDLKVSIEKCQKQIGLFPRIRKYLNDRLITDDLIEEYQFGFGQFYGRKWITFPINDIEGLPLALKLRQDPTDTTNESKYKNVPLGVSTNIFPWKVLLSKSDVLVVCEGEFDSMLLNARGIPTITSTGGAGTFKDDWLIVFRDFKKIYIVFDRDEAGAKGAIKLGKKILKKFSGKNVYQIILPEIVGDHGDITDYFIKTDGNIDKLFGEYANEIEPEYEVEQVKKTSGEWTGGEITQADIDEARSANCEDFLKIERNSGDVQFASCPFKAEKTPSFACYKGDRGYYCYSCGVSGDAITLVRELHKLNFVEAVKFVLSNKKS
jgi:DNA primase